MKPPKFHRHFDYDRRLVPNAFIARLDDGVTNIEEAKARSGYTIGYPGWNFLYYSAFCALSRERYNLIVETGTNLGLSTIILAQALKDSGLEGHVHTVELEETNFHRASENIREAGVSDLISLNLGDSIEFLKEFTGKLDRSIQFAFLDGNHTTHYAFTEFEIVHPHLERDSTVFFDNTYKIMEDDDPEQRVNGALRLIVEKFGGNLVNFQNTSWYTPGQAIWQKAPFAADWT